MRPKLIERRQLLPPLRSFSEPELSLNPASRLKLACLARCEPICSIDWHLNGQLLTPITPLRLDFARSREFHPNQSVVFTRSLELANSPLATAHLSVGLLENVVRQPNESSFAWIKQSVVGALQTNSPEALEWSSRQLRRDSDLLDESANVISKLELSYSQIEQLMARQESSGNLQELTIKCRLNSLLDALPVGERHQLRTFTYLQLAASSWFPSSSSELEELQTKDAYRLAMNNEPLDLSTLRLAEQQQDNIEAPTQEMQMSILMDSKLNFERDLRAASAIRLTSLPSQNRHRTLVSPAAA